MIKLTVIVPYYNNRTGLSRLLKTIPNIDDIEVIVVNDHSDNIDDVVSGYGMVRLINQEDGLRWAGAARNTGLSHARGEYVLFADSDDMFTEGAFDTLNSYMNGHDLVFFKPTSISDDGSESNRHLLYSMQIDSYIERNDREIFYKFHVPWSKLFKRDYLISNNIFFDEVIASNDVLFSLKSSMLVNNFLVSEKIIYCVVESCSSLTKQRSEDVIDSRFEALCRYNEYLKSIGDTNLAAMSGHLKNSFEFGFSKFLYRFFYCIYKDYPIFYGIKHLFRAMRYFTIKYRGVK